MALVIRRVLFLASALLVTVGAGCADFPLPGDGDAPPETLLAREEITMPEVEGVWLAGGNSEAATMRIVLRFSQPMERASVESAISVVHALRRVRGPGDGTAIEGIGNFEWSLDDREVLFEAASPGDRIVFVTLAESAVGRNGRHLDGTAPPRPTTDPLSYHRIEDDGYRAPASYVSLPYYPTGSEGLGSHPSLRLHNQRPGVACALPDGEPVAAGMLGEAAVARPAVACRLHDRRSVPDRTPRVYERMTPRAWDPAALPEAAFATTDASRTVSATVELGAAGGMPAREGWTVAETVGETGLRLTGLSVTAGVSTAELYVAPPGEPEPLWPVTGVTPPDLLWIDDVLYAVTNLEGGGTQDIDDESAAWVADEFAGQQFVNSKSPGSNAQIVGNSATRLELAASAQCLQGCDYRIETRVAERYPAGAELRLVSSQFEVVPAGDLAAGDWILKVQGGRDLWGSAQTDGIRDGDETEGGRPDDVVELDLTIP